MKTPNSKVSW